MIHRMLATANRSRVSIRGQSNRVIFFFSRVARSITIQNSVVVSHTVRAHKGGPKMLPHPLWTGVWLTPRTMLLRHICYHTKFGRLTSNPLDTVRESQQFWGLLSLVSWGWGRGFPLEICFSHLCCHAEICQKILTPHAPPFKVIHGHWNRHGSIGYLWLPI